MENATKALLMAGGVLIAVIVIVVLILTFKRTGSVSRGYSKTLDAEQITIFNSNFTKYQNQDLTIHEVVTICNFAKDNNVTVVSNSKTEADILDEIDSVYRINIHYDNATGYVNSISFTQK